jgi:hypothetical protein
LAEAREEVEDFGRGELWAWWVGLVCGWDRVYRDRGGGGGGAERLTRRAGVRVPSTSNSTMVFLISRSARGG